MTDNKMTAEDLAEYLLDWSVVKDNPFSQVVGGKAAQMLRRQHEAIKQLRETLETISHYVGKSNPPSRIWVRAEKALKDTEGL